ncbi:aminoglycoside phosphotransferase family protein [Deinococcus deserti]|uniref:Putative Streptomycin 3'-kinase (Streptomycin 3'-phosphotransferase) n=1 Tax=Deinococcus deserti (strain DSM 17065 / CIP 109153 / LMG 22923 / VCD115) TaxID=546414 RepID=C1CVN7_DEIDV|nr:aminoglycoside phosphotransferase family protein [Deinococcus deserti]ACO46254.1 putative Streptomycin 3'-kinase (Streptomycin 3'-phosphotransferase) [Deinococcus deserti VCD115]
MFSYWLDLWSLTPDGAPIHTPTSDLLPVLRDGKHAMLKVARAAEEERGHQLMVWWNGQGAARVLKHEGAALLMERLGSGPSLVTLAQAGEDNQATRILCGTAARLHAPRAQPYPELVPLDHWFRALEAAASDGGLLARSWETAQDLLRRPQQVCPLHGDIHHGNVLRSSQGRWLAIDPKGLIGERTFDFANVLCNPTLDHARRPGRLAQQATVLAEAARLSRRRLLQWTVAYAGLSAAWHLEDGQKQQAQKVMELGEIALAEL